MKKILPRCPLFLLTSLIVSGFGYQVYLVCDDYFKYKTTPHVDIRNYPDVNQRFIPTILICYHDQFVQRKVQEVTTIHDLFDVIFQEDVKFLRSWFVIQQNAILDTVRRGFMEVDRLYGYNVYCLGIVHRQPFRGDWRKVERDYIYRTIIERSNIMKKGGKVSINLLHPSGDFDFPPQPFVTQDVPINVSEVTSELTFSMTYARNLPPPYDTDCFNYFSIGYKSKYHCESECIRLGTTRMNFTPPLVIKSRYSDSNTSVIKNLAGYEPYLEPKELLERLLIHCRVKKSSLNETIKQVKHYYYLKDSCEKSFRRHDCRTEIMSIIPRGLSSTRLTGSSSIPETYRHRIEILPPMQPFILVTAEPKVHLLDFITYTMSCMAFWFGFCPLGMARAVSKRIQKFSHPYRPRIRQHRRSPLAPSLATSY